MAFHLIDMDAWERRAHYQYYQTLVRSSYTLTANINITGLLQEVKRRGLRFYPVFLLELGTLPVNLLPDFIGSFIISHGTKMLVAESERFDKAGHLFGLRRDRQHDLRPAGAVCGIARAGYSKRPCNVRFSDVCTLAAHCRRAGYGAGTPAPARRGAAAPQPSLCAGLLLRQPAFGEPAAAQFCGIHRRICCLYPAARPFLSNGQALRNAAAAYRSPIRAPAMTAISQPPDTALGAVFTCFGSPGPQVTKPGPLFNKIFINET